MVQTIIVLIIVGIALVFTARWTFRKLNNSAPTCCGDKCASRTPDKSSLPSCCRPPEVGGKRQ